MKRCSVFRRRWSAMAWTIALPVTSTLATRTQLCVPDTKQLLPQMWVKQIQKTNGCDHFQIGSYIKLFHCLLTEISHRHQMVSHCGSKSPRNSSTKCIRRKCSRDQQYRWNRRRNRIRRHIKLQTIMETMPTTALLLTTVTMPLKRQRNVIESH